MNNVVLMGRLTKAPEYSTTPSGTAIAKFTVAINDTAEHTDFINCIAWKKTADFINQWFKKGQMICLQGKITTRSYDDKDGNKRYVTEVTALRVEFGGDKKSEPQGEPQVVVIDDEGELPF